MKKETWLQQKLEELRKKHRLELLYYAGEEKNEVENLLDDITSLLNAAFEEVRPEEKEIPQGGLERMDWEDDVAESNKDYGYNQALKDFDLKVKQLLGEKQL